MKPGDRIRVIRMDDADGKDWQARELNGRTLTISFIDSAGQIHLEESGLALIPGVDDFMPVLLLWGKGRVSPFLLVPVESS